MGITSILCIILCAAQIHSRTHDTRQASICLDIYPDRTFDFLAVNLVKSLGYAHYMVFGFLDHVTEFFEASNDTAGFTFAFAAACKDLLSRIAKVYNGTDQTVSIIAFTST